MMRYDPKSGKHVMKSIYGGGLYEVLTDIGSALTSPLMKKAASTAFEKGVGKVGEKAREAIGEKVLNRPKKQKTAEYEMAGDKIVELLCNDPSNAKTKRKNSKPITIKEAAKRVRDLI